jgi:prolyl 4-hydroxylase
MPPRLRLSFVLLLLLPPLSQGQRVEVGDGQGHTFTYTAERDAPLTTGGLPGLSQAARRWCKAQQLAVSLDTCTQFVVTQATQKVVQARAAQGGGGSTGQSGSQSSSLLDPARGLAPGLMAYQAGQAAQSRFHDSGDAPTSREVHADRSVRLAWSPSLVHLPGFVDPETCAELIRIATPLLAPSQAKDTTKGRQLHRNSSSAMLGRQQELTDPLINRLTERIHHLMNLPPDHGEGLQVAHYLPGQSYGFHEDAFDGAPRAYTFLAFLNTPEGGGETIFPLLSANGSSGSVDPATFEGERKTDPDLMTSFCQGDAHRNIMRIQPKQGDAILFTPMRPWMQTDERALHGACHVTHGEKWVVQRWARHVYDPSYTRTYTQAFNEKGGSDTRELHEGNHEEL